SFYKRTVKNTPLFLWNFPPIPPTFAVQIKSLRGWLQVHLKKRTMSKLHFTTKHANEATVKHDWYVVDGTNQTVGRMCAKIAAILRGKNKAYYTPHVDCGDFIIVTNCEK